MSLRAALVAVALCLPLAGCAFDPGHDYGVTTTWLLNGAAPDAGRCAELSIDRFKLTMQGPDSPLVLEASCDTTLLIEGVVYGGFETTVSFDYGVLYDYTVEALDRQGAVLYSYASSVSALYGDFIPVDLDTLDVFEPSGSLASYTARWAFDGGDLAQECAQNGVETVELWITTVTDPSFDFPALLDGAPCAAGEIVSDGKVLASGDYLVRYVALDDRDAPTELGEPIEVIVDASGDIALPRQQFEGL
jgi:hypothetical protein